jgi:hypothetical protein
VSGVQLQVAAGVQLKVVSGVQLKVVSGVQLQVMLGVQLQVRISTIFELCAHSRISLTTTEFMQLACQANLGQSALRSASWV